MECTIANLLGVSATEKVFCLILNYVALFSIHENQTGVRWSIALKSESFWVVFS